MSAVDDALTGQLERLGSLVGEGDLDAVAELRRRLDQQAFRVVVAGAQKRGKSTLVNALLGRPVLPTGVVPLTAVETTLAYGAAEHVEVRYLARPSEVLPLARLADLVTEQGNPANRRGIAAVTVRLPLPLLARGLELVDTPGTGSVYAHNTAAAAEALDRMDAAIFVLSADPPISAEERVFLRAVRDRAVRLFCVLNKADRLTADEVREATAFTERVIREELGHRERVWPVSARCGLATLAPSGAGSVDPCWAEFTAALSGYLGQRQQSDLVRSIRTRAARLTGDVVEEASLTLAALALSLQDLDQRTRVFTVVLEEVARSRQETVAVAAAEIDRLLQQTNDQAGELLGRATPSARQAVETYLATLHGALDQVEREALAWAAGHIRGLVENWRVRRAEEVNAALAALDQRLAGRLDEQIRTVRDSAARLFSVDLPDWTPLPGLVPSDRFYYSFRPDEGQVEALSSAVRTHLPGSLGRERVRRHITERTALLFDQQVGRVRADFQDRLTETRRELIRQLNVRYHGGVGWITAAIERAATLRVDREAAAGRATAELQERRRAAVLLLQELQPSPADADEDGLRLAQEA